MFSDAERAKVAAKIQQSREERLSTYARYGVHDHTSFRRVIRDKQKEIRAHVSNTVAKGDEAIQALDELLEADAAHLEFEAAGT